MSHEVHVLAKAFLVKQEKGNMPTEIYYRNIVLEYNIISIILTEGRGKTGIGIRCLNQVHLKNKKHTY